MMNFCFTGELVYAINCLSRGVVDDRVMQTLASLSHEREPPPDAIKLFAHYTDVDYAKYKGLRAMEGELVPI